MIFSINAHHSRVARKSSDSAWQHWFKCPCPWYDIVLQLFIYVLTQWWTGSCYSNVCTVMPIVVFIHNGFLIHLSMQDSLTRCSPEGTTWFWVEGTQLISLLRDSFPIPWKIASTYVVPCLHAPIKQWYQFEVALFSLFMWYTVKWILKKQMITWSTSSITRSCMLHSLIGSQTKHLELFCFFSYICTCYIGTNLHYRCTCPLPKLLE